MKCAIERERLRQYQICQARAHQPKPSGVFDTTFPTKWKVCRHCDTEYCLQEQLVERGAPVQPPLTLSMDEAVEILHWWGTCAEDGLGADIAAKLQRFVDEVAS